MEMVTSWEEEGFEKGMEKGIEKGRAEGTLAVVLALLAKRLGPLPVATEARVRALPIASLQALAETVLDLETVKDVDRWLAQRA